VPDLNARSVRAEVYCENAKHRPCLGRTGDSSGVFSAGAVQLAGMEGGGASCGSVGDEGGEDVMGRRGVLLNPAYDDISRSSPSISLSSPPSS
jgi:hypothetical protein